jgi:flagellar basal body-associated protein FliL
MATEADEAPEKAKQAKKGKAKGGGAKKKIILLVGALAVFGLGAKMTVLKATPPPACPPGTPPTTAVDATASSTVPTTAAPGQTTATTAVACTPPVPSGVVKLDPITLNLADGRYLKLGLGLQLDSTEDVTKFPDTDGGSEALDQAISILGAKSYVDLSTPEARAAVKDDLSLAVSKAYDGHVIQVFFTEFVMQ